MTAIHQYCEHIALSIAVAGGLGFFAISAPARTNSCTDIRSAQQQLKSDGYYNGKVDGTNGPMTRSAIRKYQKDNNLRTTGRLDNATCGKLGVSETSANRSATEPSATPNGAPMSNAEYKAKVESAQRQLKQKGFYTGSLNGVMNAKTETAIRKFQESNGMSVTGKLDQNTMNSLGVSQQH